MCKTDFFIIPEAPVRQQAAVARRQEGTPGVGIRLGVLDNSKGNADHLLGLLVESLRAAVSISSVTSLRKPNAAAAASGAILDRFVAEADFVVSAMAD
jgi:hypothetical protein